MYLSFNHILEGTKNTIYIEKCLEFDTVILTFTEKVPYLISWQKMFFVKGWSFIGPQNQRFLSKKGVFSSKIHEKGVFFKLGYEHGHDGISFDRGWGRVEIPEVSIEETIYEIYG